MITLSKRLQAVADMVSIGNRVADIGCDHGYVSIYLMESGRTPHVIAMDVNAGPIERAKEHIKEHQLIPYIETRLSNGTQNLQPGEADSLICAGMGGRLVIRILSEGIEKISLMKELILQPQSELYLLRRFLPTIGYEIADENMVYEDGKYYPMMRAVPQRKRNTGEPKIDKDTILNRDLEEIYDMFGKILIQKKHSVLQDFLNFQGNKIEKLIHDLTNNDAPTEKQKKRLLELQKEWKMIQDTQVLMGK